VRDLLARGLPAAFFATAGLLRWDRFWNNLASWQVASSPDERIRIGLACVQVVLELTFYLMVAGLFVVRARAVARDNRPRAILLAIGGAVGAAPLVFMPPIEPGVALRLVASLLMAGGMLASCLILAVLGRHFGVRPGARGLVSHGAYARVRHPLYVAEAISQLGILITVLSPMAVLTYALYLLLQFRRALLEERVLAATFPAYREYQARTSRFIPGLI
jgi:protein-S-isoprenylcysteine O-methyltransferase Ste14